MNIKEPKAQKILSSFEIHGQKVEDYYAWLRDNNWPQVNEPRVLKYLKQENRYYNKFFNQLKLERKKVLKELKGMIQLSDQSTYIKKDDYYYYTKINSKDNYIIYCRKKGSVNAQEEILLDVNKISQDGEFIKIGDFAVSPDHKLIAYSVDYCGGERYFIKIYDLENKKYLKEEIPNTFGNIIWHEKINGFFYTIINESWRSDKLMFHIIGQSINSDKLVFHEVNNFYSVIINKSNSNEYVFIILDSLDCNEYYFIAMSDYSFAPILLAPRRTGAFYDVEHNSDYFYVKTNYKAKNFRILRFNTNDPINKNWDQSYIKECEQQYLISFDITDKFLILNYSVNALPLIKIKEIISGLEERVVFHKTESAFNAEAYSTNYLENDIRVDYSSLVQPSITYSYSFLEKKLLVLKTQKIPSGFNSDEYGLERIFIPNDGVQIPITLLYKKSLFKKDGSNPLYLYAYGAYGISVPVNFRYSAISLVNRGFIYAISHVRGGEELGYSWYEDSKFLNKKRTFYDFIASIEELVEQKYTNKGNIIICGGSAGGLIVGSVINEKSELFKSVIAHVPFVDALNTMLDETLPLTTREFKEWGNPKERIFFEYIKSYSPYDNVKVQKYPNIMVTSGISDTRVGYWEASKWVAKIRSYKTNNSLLLLKTNMNSGHAGSSKRLSYLKEIVDELVFIFKTFEVNV